MTSYFTDLCGAYIRGYLQSQGEEIPDTISIPKYKKSIDKLYNFKKTDLGLLPRVKWIMGILRGIYVESIIDFGSQRGALLWPLMDEFKHIDFTAVDLDPETYDYLMCVKNGGIDRITPVKGDITDLKEIEGEQKADLVIASEIFEHLEVPQKAAEEAIRLAKSYIVVTVPRKPDDNPEHIQLFTEETLSGLFNHSNRVSGVKTTLLNNNITAFVTLK